MNNVTDATTGKFVLSNENQGELSTLTFHVLLRFRLQSNTEILAGRRNEKISQPFCQPWPQRDKNARYLFLRWLTPDAPLWQSQRHQSGMKLSAFPGDHLSASPNLSVKCSYTTLTHLQTRNYKDLLLLSLFLLQMELSRWKYF